MFLSWKEDKVARLGERIPCWMSRFIRRCYTIDRNIVFNVYTWQIVFKIFAVRLALYGKRLRGLSSLHSDFFLSLRRKNELLGKDFFVTGSYVV